MPAVSKKQRIAAAIAEHHPEKATGAAKDMAKSLSKDQLHDFASTSEKGLPEKKSAWFKLGQIAASMSKEALVEEGDWLDRYRDLWATTMAVRNQHPWATGLAGGGAVPYLQAAVEPLGIPSMAAKLFARHGKTDAQDPTAEALREVKTPQGGEDLAQTIQTRARRTGSATGGIAGAVGGYAAGMNASPNPLVPAVMALLGGGAGAGAGWVGGNVMGSLAGRGIRDRLRGMTPGRAEAAVARQKAHPYAMELPFGKLISSIADTEKAGADMFAFGKTLAGA